MPLGICKLHFDYQIFPIYKCKCKCLLHYPSAINFNKKLNIEKWYHTCVNEAYRLDDQGGRWNFCTDSISFFGQEFHGFVTIS